MSLMNDGMLPLITKLDIITVNLAISFSLISIKLLFGSELLLQAASRTTFILKNIRMLGPGFADLLLPT
jgi:hypothetical protein